MKRHLGKREREARKRRMKCSKSKFGTWNYSTGGITLNLGRKKFSEAMGKTVDQLKKKFRGCVVDAER